MKRCAVLGSGEVGQTLSKGLKKHGYEVRIGSRTPAKLGDFSKSSGIPRRYLRGNRVLGRHARARGRRAPAPWTRWVKPDAPISRANW